MRYPNKQQKVKSNRNNKNLGMTLEKDIDVTNKYYLQNNIAVIHKKPTPITVVNVNYPSRNKAKITEAYYKVPSTTDYNGVYKGKYIDFDAKETSSKTSFPLSNIHSHQFHHLKQVHENGGIAFLIVHFKSLGLYFLLPFKTLSDYWFDQFNGGRKSIPIKAFTEKAQTIKFGLNPRLDYLKVI